VIDMEPTMASYLLASSPADDPVPRGGDDLDLETHALGDLGADGRVEAHHLVLVVDEVEGRIGPLIAIRITPASRIVSRSSAAAIEGTPRLIAAIPIVATVFMKVRRIVMCISPVWKTSI
jgi:hypothetical protein